MAARNESKVTPRVDPSHCIALKKSFLVQATGAIASLEEEGLSPGQGQVLWLKLDLSDPRSAKRAAEEFLTRETRLDVLGTDLHLFLPSVWCSS